ncbi:MAG: hypothetical protein KGJ58_02210 [Patescibacteria group bacterium]|nr:hypothetical protein [Patescibacteria group bacterium]MDE1988609.1 hypothetical protein [Patescibacteria group bacterium]MDE2218240.1 hypothetical protein [Patescibacteria group bacterium]
MNIIAPIFLILASVGIFYGYVNPNYRGENVPENILKLMDERKQYADVLANSNNLIAERNKLVDMSNHMSSGDLDRLKKLLPDHIDNVRLIIDINGIASKYGLNIREIKIDGDNGNNSNNSASNLNGNVSGVSGSKALGPDNNLYGTLTLKFKINASYDRFRSFITDMQKSLRVIDIVGVSFDSTDTGYYDYGVTIKTYWIKNNQSN